MRNNRGFTLVEILISIIILGVILTGFFQFFIFSQQTTTKNQDKLVAINVAQKALEQIKEDVRSSAPVNDSFWEIAHPDNTIVYPKNYGPISESIDGQTYHITVTVDTQLDNGLHMVTVTVKGNDERVLSTVKGLVEL